MTNENLWKAVLAQIQLDISEANFNTWFKHTGVSAFNKDRVTISVPNSFVKDWLANKYHKNILKALKELDGNIKKVSYTIDPSLSNKTKEEDGKREKKKEEKNANQMEFLDMATDYETGLNPKYTFDNFIIGPFNELAHAASFAVSENPGSMYNPLFIYSKTGLGKTHLLQAVGNRIKEKRADKKVLYIQAQKFISEIISSIRNNRMEEFKNKYKDIDVLIIDDIQFLSGKEKTQEEFFHTFNDLYEKNKQIILSSDRPPKSINSLTDRLRSRFEGGMITDIIYPDTETRAAILKTKTQEKNFHLNDEICYYIAESTQKNIRELEGVLNKLIVHQQINRVPLNINNVKDILGKILQSSPTTFSFHKIMKCVTDFYDINEKDVMSSSRKKEIVKSRQLVIYLLRKELKYSYPYIAKKIGGKDHTTVIYSFNKIEKELKNNNEMKEELSFIRENLISV